MKIALIIYKYLPLKGGGEGYLANLANQLAKRDHEIHVYAHTWESNNEKIHFHTIPAIRFPKVLKDISFVVNSYNVMAKNDYDIVQVVGRALGMNVFNPHCGVEKAWLKQDSLTISNHFFRFLKNIRTFFCIRERFLVWLEHKQYSSKRLSRIIAISDMMKNDIIRHHNVDPQKITVVYNGVDLQRFNPTNKIKYRNSIRKKLSLGNDFVILYVSNNFRLKGLSVLIKAMGEFKKSHNNFKVLIIGRSRDSAYRKLGITMNCQKNLIFLGHVDGIEKYYAASDICVHPTFYDTYSLVVIEAMASGLPVITTSFAGASGIIDNGKDGFVISDPSDYLALSEKTKLLFNDDFREKASIAARKKAEKYPAENNCDEIIKVYNKVIMDRDG